MTDRAGLIAQLSRHEGRRHFPYTDTVGKLTIGVGRNLTDVGLSDATIDQMLNEDIDQVLADMDTFPWFAGLDPIRQRVVADMRFNLGGAGFRKFKKTMLSVAEGNYDLAATQMLQSKWAKQVGRRARTLAQMMRTGREDFSEA